MDISIANLIKKKRKEKHLTLEEVAAAVGVSKGTVSKWERGHIMNMGRDKIEALCSTLNISPVVLVKGTDENVETEEITRTQFKKEVSNLLYKCTDLSDQEKEILKSVINTIDK